MLEATNITSWRNHDAILEGIDFSVDNGELLWIRGANGSGKTTLIRILAGLRNTDEGEIRWRGTDIREARTEFAAQSVFVGHLDALKHELSVRHNLEFYGQLRHREFDPAMIKDSLDRVGMVQSPEQRVGTLSAGQRRRTALARLLLAAAKLWLLDEPMTALDVQGRQTLEKLILDHLNNAGLVVFSSHQALEDERLKKKMRILDLK